MNKVIISIVNTPVGAEKKIFDDTKMIELQVEDIYDIDYILTEIEPQVELIEDRDSSTISMSISTEYGRNIYNGSLQNGSLMGVKVS